MSDQAENIQEGEENGEEKEVQQIEEPDVDQDDMYPPQSWEIKRIHDLIKGGLSVMAKSACGQFYGFAQLNLQKKGITTLFDLMQEYPHLRKINLSSNLINDFQGITTIFYLTDLNLSNNMIDSMQNFNKEGVFTFLVNLNLSGNKLNKLQAIKLPRLKVLDLTNNLIDNAEEFTGHHEVETLILKKNKLKNMKGIAHMKSLLSIFAAENQITNFNDLLDLPSLKTLHLRKNLIDSFSEQLPDLPKLNQLNIRENKIEKLKEIGKLVLFNNSLKTLIVSGNPVAEEVGDAIQQETIMMIPVLTRINQDPVEGDEVKDALNELKERREEEERKRLEEEEARRLAEEEEAAQQKEEALAAAGGAGQEA